VETYKIGRIQTDTGEVWTVGFGKPATNDEIVKDVTAHLKGQPPSGGTMLLLDGPASLPVAFAMCHATAHLYGSVAVKDPKLGAFVVCVSHDPARPVGALYKV
jgi:CRISPR-associated protein Csx3